MAASYHPLGHDPATAAPNAVAGNRLWLVSDRRIVSARPEGSGLAGDTAVHPGRSAGILVAMVMVTILLVIGSAVSWAQQPAAHAQPDTKIGGKASDPCVAVDIAGRRAGDADCAAQKLQDAAKAAQDHAQNQTVPNIPSADAPDTQIGVANQTATKQRLGDSFGKSVLPQRPTPPPPTPTPFTRQ